MLKKILNTSVTLLLCNALATAPLLRAAQLSLPSADLIAPVINQENYQHIVTPGSDHAVTVKVTDNIGVAQVTLYYRVIGKGDYKRRNMQALTHSDNYMAKVTADEIKTPGIEYYIKAMDQAGNTLLHGHSFSPLSVKISTTPTDSLITNRSKSIDIKTATEKEKGISKWVWIGLGVLLIGAAAGGGGGGGGDEPTTLSITASEP